MLNHIHFTFLPPHQDAHREPGIPLDSKYIQLKEAKKKTDNKELYLSLLDPRNTPMERLDILSQMPTSRQTGTFIPYKTLVIQIQANPRLANTAGQEAK